MDDMNLPEPFRYQVYARQKIVKRQRTAVIAPPGAGKTRPIVEGINDLGGWDKRVLVVCTGSAVATWKRQIPLWSGRPELEDDINVVTGTKLRRRGFWEYATKNNRQVFIINSAIFLRDYELISQIPWETVIADEYHKFMRRHHTTAKSRGKKKRPTTYGLFRKMTRHTPNMVLATGSLVRRNASSMYTAFQLVAPKIWSSYWKFVNMFCHIDEGAFGQQIYGVKNAEQLRAVMDEYFVYLPPEVVVDSLPEGHRYGIDVEIDAEQRRIYDELEDEMLSFVGDELIYASTVLGKIIKQRQLLCCPKILDPSLGMGAGFEAILDHLDQDSHVVIFVPFRPACDFVAEALRAKKYNVGVLRGGIDDVEQTAIREEFMRSKGIIVCTIAYAESFDLDTCQNSYFLGYDLTVDQNEQAEGRTRRAISKHQLVSWGYIKTNTEIDWHFLQKLGEDASNAKMIMGRSDDYIRKLKEHNHE